MQKKEERGCGNLFIGEKKTSVMRRLSRTGQRVAQFAEKQGPSNSQTDKEETVQTNGKTRVSFFEEERQEEKPCFFIELVCPKTHFVQSIKSNSCSFLPPVF